MDLAGKNETVIIRYPDVNDVTGLTIDYTDDRLKTDVKLLCRKIYYKTVVIVTCLIRVLNAI